MTSPIVSVVMPVRDAASYIDAAVHSIRRQTLAAFELIVVDDGSGDASAVIAARHAADDDRIRILTLPPSGIAVALNHGVVAARCRYVARIDADDVAMPERLALQVAVLERHPSVAVVGSACQIIDASGATIGQIDVPTTADSVRALLTRDNCMLHSTTTMRREAALAAGGYRRAFAPCEDYDLWLRIAERHDLVNLAEPLMRCRQHEFQRSRQASDQQAMAMLAAQDAARERRAGRAEPIRLKAETR
jgi:glycosyltransferase involved in cell wall biosynthesis